MYKIFLKVGDGCNLQCSYCMQQHSPVSYKCNDEFILSLKKQHPDTIFCLLGGEPLLYKQTIKHIIDDLLFDVRINVITNGKLLDEEWVSYFNERDNIKVIVSWDGESSSHTRGYDVLKENYTNLVKLKNLWISSLITNDSCIMDKCDILDKLNYDRHNMGMDETIPNIKLAYGITYTKETIRKLSQELRQIKFGLIDNRLSNLWYMQQKKIFDSTNKSQDLFCGANVFVLHYTISGEKRRCFFDDDLSNVEEPYINIIKDNCEMCEVKKICMHQCPIKLDNMDNFCLACKTFYSYFI